MTSELELRQTDLIKRDRDKNNLSLSQKLAIGLEEIKFKKDLQRKIFLLDVSGSMDEYIEGKSKLDHLKDNMKDYPDARKVCFSTDVYCSIDNNGFPNCDIPSHASGSTDLAKAIRYLRSLPKRPDKIVLVSDGEPDNEQSAMKEAMTFSVPFDIIFIGEKGSDGEIFMINLARKTGGKEFTIESKQNFQKQLSVKIAGLLTSG